MGQLRDLKALLEGLFGGAPRLLLRRMKEDELPDLPKAEFHAHEVSMPTAQAAYDALIANVMADYHARRGSGGLQRLRLIALHPDPQMRRDAEFTAASARAQMCFDALDHVAAAGSAR